jgi:hypothetical protein
VDAKTALEAYQLREATYGASKLLSAKRAQLKRIVDAHVAQHGPLVVGQDETGQPITYGPKKVLAARVPDIPALVAEVQEMGRPDLLRRLKLEDAKGFAEDVGMTKPFASGGLESVRMKWRVTNNVEGVEEDDDVEIDEDEKPEPRRLKSDVGIREPAPEAQSPIEFLGIV